MRCIIRPLLFFQSIFYVITGGGLLIWSIIYGLEHFDGWDGSELSCIAVANIVIGGGILLLGLLGLFTSCSGSYSWSYCYSIIILVFIIIQCILGILVVIFKSYSYHSEGVYHSMLRTVWDLAQASLHCCGTQRPEDWLEAEQTVPVSCEAAQPAANSSLATEAVLEKYETGCLEMLARLMEANVVVVIVVLVSVVVVQMLGVCLSCCLARSVQVEHWDY